jgi:hypothetical protein
VLFYSVLCWFFLCSCHLTAASELQTLEIFWKITLYQIAAILNNNLDCKRLNSLKDVWAYFSDRLTKKQELYKEFSAQYSEDYSISIYCVA